MICENCLVNPICKIGCEKLLETKNSITMEDFEKYINLPERLMMTKKRFILKLNHNIKVHIHHNSCEFRKNGKYHREDGPAVEYSNGDKCWYKNGKRHREDGPAVDLAEGTEYWYINGKLHRVDGPAIEHVSGDKHWYKNGELHRVDGPAVEHADGRKAWYKNGVDSPL